MFNETYRLTEIELVRGIRRMNSLTIARYKDGYIKISEYNKSIHKNGEIFCPFCDPPLEVTGVKNKFFRALPSRGGHNCGKQAAQYFNAKWEGRRLIETLSGKNGEIEVTIDINHLGKMSKGLRKTKKPIRPTANSSQGEIEIYNRYTTYKNVIRDVVRTVAQMKNFIEKNSIDKLNKIKFKYKMGSEELNINEVVKLIDEIDPSLHKKDRFVIYKVDRVRIRGGNIYINSYQTEGVNLATSFSYPSKTNRTGIKKNDYVIAFGTLSYYKPKDQYYLNTLSDLNVVKVKDEELKELFSSKEMTKKTIEKASTEKTSFANVKKDAIQVRNQSKKQIAVSSIIDSKSLELVNHVRIDDDKSQAKVKCDIENSISEEDNKIENKKYSFIKTAVRRIGKLFKR